MSYNLNICFWNDCPLSGWLFGTCRLVPSTKLADEWIIRALTTTTSRVLPWSPWLHWAAHLSMNPQSCFSGGEHALPKTKTKTQKFCQAYPCTSELCSNHTMPCSPLAPRPDPMPLVNKPASTFPVVTCYPLSSWYGSRAGPIKLALFPTPGQEFSGSSSLRFSPRVI